MNKIVESFTWLGGKPEKNFKPLVKPIISDYTEVGIVSIHFVPVRPVSIGFMIYENPFNKTEKLKLEISFTKDSELLDYLRQFSHKAVKEHVVFVEFNKIRIGKNMKSLNNKEEMDKTNKTFIDLSNTFDKRGYLVPSIEIEEKKAKLMIPSNSNCEFYFMNDYAINHVSVANKSYIDLYKINNETFPEIMYGINIKFNVDSSKSTNLLYKKVDDLNINQMLYVTLYEKYLNTFKIQITDPTGQEVETDGSIVLHFISK